MKVLQRRTFIEFTVQSSSFNFKLKIRIAVFWGKKEKGKKKKVVLYILKKLNFSLCRHLLRCRYYLILMQELGFLQHLTNFLRTFFM